MRRYDPTYHIQQALALLDKMDDAITGNGGDDDEYGRKELAKIRRIKDHVRRTAAPDANLGWHDNPNAPPRVPLIGTRYQGPYECPQCGCGSKDLRPAALAIVQARLGPTFKLRCQICDRVFLLNPRREQVCPECGGTGLGDAVLTPEELARAIVHKTAKCTTCGGNGVTVERKD